MILTDVFDDISDPVMILSDEGVMSYSNRAAKKLVQGDTIDTIGIPPLQRLFRELGYGNLQLPLTFQFRTEDHQRFMVKINRLYSAFVVHCMRLNPVQESQTLRRNIVKMLHDLLSEPLEQFEDGVEAMLADLSQKGLLERIERSTYESVIELSKLLTRHISHIHELGELYLDDFQQSHENIPASSLLDGVLEHYEDEPRASEMIRVTKVSNDNLFCNDHWMETALISCVDYALKQADSDDKVLIKHESNRFFHQFTVFVRDEDFSEVEKYESDTPVTPMRSQDFDYSDSLELELLLAQRVLEMHGGQLIVDDTSKTERLVLELPADGQQAKDDMMVQQAKLYAQDLAQLKSQAQLDKLSETEI
jgi:K+-sensing histidine kinase KdpD